MHNLDCKSLKQWFLNEKRDLPWRQNSSPYSVWVSEVMLQQTQVSVVIPYFLRWMQRFPTIKALAEASLNEVIKEWEGLGYYSRARNLHEGARYVLENYKGILPDTKEELQKIKGLGPYTVGAILSFAFHKRAAAVDGNVIRVLSRYLCIEEDMSKGKNVDKLRLIAENILPKDESWIVNEALIELGATICSKAPKCSRCPLKTSCQAFLKGKEKDLPFKSAKIKIESLYRTVAVIRCGDHLLIKKGEKGQIMSDLYEFPYFETDEKGISESALERKIKQKFGVKLDLQGCLDEVSHSFTRFRVKLNPILLESKKQFATSEYQWVSREQIKKLAFSSGHRRILEGLPGAIVVKGDSTQRK